MSQQTAAGLSTIEDAIAAIGRGEIVIVVDDPGRENEGDFVMAADKVTPEAINFMVRHGRGLVCMPMTAERADRLGLRPMVAGRLGDGSTAFTVSIDLKDPPTTGISAFDRARCIARAAADDARADEFTVPGHVFPLRAEPGGVLTRAGHTEAAVDLARLAGCDPSGVVCEILNPDGTMARMPDLIQVAGEHGLLVVTIEDLIAFRRRNEGGVNRAAAARLPTPFGVFTAVGYTAADGIEHVALVYGDPATRDAPLVRLHSECLTGDAFGSLRCDCGAQLQEALRRISEAGAGVVVYLRGHEGRGIGLVPKLMAYELQEDGADTVEANLMLGYPADSRDYAVAAEILADLGIPRVLLMTNNPAKQDGLECAGIVVVARERIEIPVTTENLRYLQAKRDRLNHELALEHLGAAFA